MNKLRLSKCTLNLIMINIVLLLIIVVLLIHLKIITNKNMQNRPVYTAEFLESCSEEELLNLHEVGIEKSGIMYYPVTLEDEKILDILKCVNKQKENVAEGYNIVVRIGIQKPKGEKQLNEIFIEDAINILKIKNESLTLTIPKNKMCIEDKRGDEAYVPYVRITKKYLSVNKILMEK